MKAFGATAVLLLCGVAHAQDAGDGFIDTKDGGKRHPSGFVCPARIGHFERDAVGDKDSESNAGFCAYSAQDGTYGTITLSLLSGPYDPKLALASDFTQQEGIGAKRIGEATAKAGPLSIYTRTYETSRVESLHYSILFTAAPVGAWAVEATVEYADPRDINAKNEFLNTVYTAAAKQIAAAKAIAPVMPVIAQPKPVIVKQEPIPAPATPKPATPHPTH